MRVGEKYLWQIFLQCDEKASSDENIFTEAVIKVVTVPPNLAGELSRTTDHRKRAELYANAGFWYEAFREIFNEPSSKSSRLMLLEKLSKLAPQIALNVVDEELKENKNLKKDLQQHAQQLRTIFNREIKK